MKSLLKFASILFIAGISLNSARAENNANCNLLGVKVKKLELEVSSHDYPIEVTFETNGTEGLCESGKTYLRAEDNHFYQAILAAFQSDSSVDVKTDCNGYIERLEVEKK